MKYSIEEIKTLLEGITPGAWAAEEVQYQWKTSNALGKHILCIYTEPDAKFIAAAPTIIRDLLAEVERLQESGNEILRCNKLWEEKYHAAQALAATHLADQELLVGQERKRVARECAEIADSNADEYQDEMNIYPDGDPKVEVYEKAMVACEYIAKEIRIRYGVEG